MAYTAAEGRQELLDQIAAAVGELAFALACLGEAYEKLDEYTADALEERLFGPVQRAYGGAKRAHAEFAARHRAPAQAFPPAEAPGGSGVPALIEQAVDAIAMADAGLATMQDSDVWIEVGDREVRAAVADVRERIAGLPERARELTRRLGR
jgi:hypothetical protein